MYNSEKDIRLHARFIKNDTKNTLAVFLSFVLTFLLLTVMLVLIHTNHRIANIQLKAELTPSDCYVEELSKEQARQITENPAVLWTALQQGTYKLYKRNNQNVFLNKQDNAAITMMSKLVDGRRPQKEGEVAAEKWVLLNLGIEPVTGQDILISDDETGKEEKFRLVGILSDMYANKKYGVLNLYSSMDSKSTEPYVVYVKFRNPADYDGEINALKEELDIEDQQIHECPARENFRELYLTDAKIISVLLMICLVVFYGVYRITALSRVQQYGVLRAVGMKRGQLYKMLLSELYYIYLAGVPVGIVSGLLVSFLVMLVSGDRETKVYLRGEAVQFHLVIPVCQIAVCVVIVFVLISLIGCLTGRRVAGSSVIDTISGEALGKNDSHFHIRQTDGKTGTIFRMSCKYIFKDLKTSGFAALTICLGVTLFTGLAYKAETLKIYREDTKEMSYLNGEYALTMLHFDCVDEGISREDVKKIEGLEEISSVKTSSGLPIRVIDESGVKRNDKYYDEYNERLKEIYGYGNSGHDGKNQIYKSMLLGYNEHAMGELKKYVIEGEFHPDDMKEDEVILFVPLMDDTKNNELPGFYKEGTPLMEYHAGDEIGVKYREDLETGSLEYKSLEDYGAAYIYKNYKIAAIVSFPYMYDCNITVYPLLITSDRYMRKLVPESGIQCMYCDGDGEMGASRQSSLEQKLIRLGSKNQNIATRSLIAETKQNEMFYHKQMVYICGVSVITFILVMINMINNVRYRMQKRTKEICMLRAVGMSVAMIRRMMLFENLILGTAAVAAARILSWPVLMYLYRMSDMRAFGHRFQFAGAEFLAVSAGAVAICVFLSFRVLKTWRTRQVVEGIRMII